MQMNKDVLIGRETYIKTPCGRYRRLKPQLERCHCGVGPVDLKSHIPTSMCIAAYSAYEKGFACVDEYYQ